MENSSRIYSDVFCEISFACVGGEKVLKGWRMCCPYYCMLIFRVLIPESMKMYLQCIY